jgi:hypothetical protein
MMKRIIDVQRSGFSEEGGGDENGDGGGGWKRVKGRGTKGVPERITYEKLMQRIYVLGAPGDRDSYSKLSERLVGDVYGASVRNRVRISQRVRLERMEMVKKLQSGGFEGVVRMSGLGYWFDKKNVLNVKGGDYVSGAGPAWFDVQRKMCTIVSLSVVTGEYARDGDAFFRSITRDVVVNIPVVRKVEDDAQGTTKRLFFSMLGEYWHNPAILVALADHALAKLDYLGTRSPVENLRNMLREVVMGVAYNSLVVGKRETYEMVDPVTYGPVRFTKSQEWCARAMINSWMFVRHIKRGNAEELSRSEAGGDRNFLAFMRYMDGVAESQTAEGESSRRWKQTALAARNRRKGIEPIPSRKDTSRGGGVGEGIATLFGRINAPFPPADSLGADGGVGAPIVLEDGGGGGLPPVLHTNWDRPGFHMRSERDVKRIPLCPEGKTVPGFSGLSRRTKELLQSTSTVNEWGARMRYDDPEDPSVSFYDSTMLRFLRTFFANPESSMARGVPVEVGEIAISRPFEDQKGAEMLTIHTAEAPRKPNGMVCVAVVGSYEEEKGDYSPRTHTYVAMANLRSPTRAQRAGMKEAWKSKNRAKQAENYVPNVAMQKFATFVATARLAVSDTSGSYFDQDTKTQVHRNPFIQLKHMDGRYYDLEIADTEVTGFDYMNISKRLDFWWGTVKATYRPRDAYFADLVVVYEVGVSMLQQPTAEGDSTGVFDTPEFEIPVSISGGGDVMRETDLAHLDFLEWAGERLRRASSDARIPYLSEVMRAGGSIAWDPLARFTVTEVYGGSHITPEAYTTLGVEYYAGARRKLPDYHTGALKREMEKEAKEKAKEEKLKKQMEYEVGEYKKFWSTQPNWKEEIFEWKLWRNLWYQDWDLLALRRKEYHKHRIRMGFPVENDSQRKEREMAETGIIEEERITVNTRLLETRGTFEGVVDRIYREEVDRVGVRIRELEEWEKKEVRVRKGESPEKHAARVAEFKSDTYSRHKALLEESQKKRWDLFEKWKENGWLHELDVKDLEKKFPKKDG